MIEKRAGLSLNQKFITSNRRTIFSSSWGEEQQLVFVVLPKLKNDDPVLDSTYLVAKTREEQQQMRAIVVLPEHKN